MEETSSLPPTKAAENPPFVCPYLYLVLAALSFISLSLVLWDEEDGVAGMVIVFCTFFQPHFLIPFVPRAAQLASQPMVYFVDESFAFAFTIYLLEPSIPSMAAFVIFITIFATMP